MELTNAQGIYHHRSTTHFLVGLPACQADLDILPTPILCKYANLVPFDDHNVVQGKPYDVDSGIVAPVLGLGKKHEFVRGGCNVLALVGGNHVANDVVGVVQDLGFPDMERLGLHGLSILALFPEMAILESNAEGHLRWPRVFVRVFLHRRARRKNSSCASEFRSSKAMPRPWPFTGTSLPELLRALGFKGTGGAPVFGPFEGDGGSTHLYHITNGLMRSSASVPIARNFRREQSSLPDTQKVSSIRTPGWARYASPAEGLLLTSHPAHDQLG
ncbi:hypothetical protein PG993_013681 [Apiospora rasikravindrae]|uniref:Uncharacterized protein n=1 Tax=Apiospora rasikravindrae TaxID=990691 RepID=A0ABR1RQW9_9PEZI